MTRALSAAAALVLVAALYSSPRAETAPVVAVSPAAQAAAAVKDLRSWWSSRRLKAVAVLEKLGGPEAAAALTGALKSGDADVRQAAAEAVARVGGEARAAALAPLLKDRKVAVRKAAIEGLAASGDESALLGLALASRDPDDGLRSYAIARFSGLKGAQPAALISLFLDDEEEDIRREAVERLGVLKDPAAVPMLARVAAGDKDRKLRITAVHGLGSIGTTEAARGVARAVSDRDPWVRRRAVETLGSLQDPAGVAALSRLILKEKDPGVKEAAIDALGEIGDARAIPGLNEVVFKGGRDLRPVAEKAVKKIIARRREAVAPEPESAAQDDALYCRVASAAGAGDRSAKKAFKRGDYLESLAAAQAVLAVDPKDDRSARLAEESKHLIAASLVERALAAETARGTGDAGPLRRHCADLARIETNHPMIRFLQKRCLDSPPPPAPAASPLPPEAEAPRAPEPAAVPAAPPTAEPAAVSSATPAVLPVAEPAAVSSGAATASVPEAAAADPGEAGPQAARSHRFVKGDSLWSLAVKYYGNGSFWKKILEANQERIKDPSSIEIGSELLIP